MVSVYYVKIIIFNKCKIRVIYQLNMKYLTTLTITLLLSLQGYGSLYSDSKVIILNESNFEELVLKSNRFWIIHLYAPWSGHCKVLVHEWKKAAEMLDGIALVGALDCIENQSFQKFVQGYPTIKFYGQNKEEPKDYYNGRIAKDIAQYVIEEMKQTSIRRLNSHYRKDNYAIILDDINFETLVFGSGEMWIVLLSDQEYDLQRMLDYVAKKLEGKVKVGKVEIGNNPRIMKKYFPFKVPTVKVFPPVIDYTVSSKGELDIIALNSLNILESFEALKQLAKDINNKLTHSK